MESVKVLNKGQIVIPASIRKKYAIKPGNRIQMFEYGRLIYLVPQSDDPVGEAKGCLPSEPSLSEELLAERKRERNG
ncbi:MAG TPA: AbrB/MazE/SpoVT family DNA-binding domain-containing protein [Deltaproteobacteria bacterium]|nr:AbrB/MazE/SpoVT family DNA-binding domain-containing protein [Deltaproteobacteria bacterium]HPR56674.1 AbrB/MazE/SpoVT family DNA-binding domain-containing protein [Deltaproteobacteria bacterium]